MLKNIQIRILSPLINALPSYATSGSAGIDLRAALNEDIIVNPNDCVLIKTGLAIYIADNKYAATIIPRSGLGHKNGIVLGNLVGLIDSDYQGELMVSCWNRSDTSYVIQPLDRIAQMIFFKVEHPTFEVVKEFKLSSRGEKGFGSTGK